MDPTLLDEQQSQVASAPKTHGFVHDAHLATGRAVITPTSLARRCDDIIGLIDELLTPPALGADRANILEDRSCGETPRTDPGSWRAGAGGGNDVAR